MFGLFSKLFSNKHLIIILFSLIILVIVMGLTLNHRELTWPEKFLKDTISLTQGILYKPASKIAGFFEDINNYTLTYKENKSLKKILHQYSQVVAELNQLRDENKRLKEMLDYKEKAVNQYQLKVGQVIARSPDRWNNMLIIDQGSNDGIKKDMAVITTQGLIGKVYSVSSFSSTVQLVSSSTDGGFIFAAIQSEPMTYGVVEGYDKKRNELQIKKIDLDAVIEPGQLVTTSNLGGVFPSGIVIGKVVRVEEGENGGLTKTAYVQPAADLYHINEVYIVMKTNVQSSNSGTVQESEETPSKEVK